MTNSAVVTLRLSTSETEYLVTLVHEFCDLVDADSTADAPDRLTPAAYPDDYDANTDFEATTRDELLRRRSSDAHDVLDDLTSAQKTKRATRVEIAANHHDAWLRTLTALRLVLAERLGITKENPTAPKDPNYAGYEWLGVCLEVLIQSLNSPAPAR